MHSPAQPEGPRAPPFENTYHPSPNTLSDPHTSFFGLRFTDWYRPQVDRSRPHRLQPEAARRSQGVVRRQEVHPPGPSRQEDPRHPPPVRCMLHNFPFSRPLVATLAAYGPRGRFAARLFFFGRAALGIRGLMMIYLYLLLSSSSMTTHTITKIDEAR